MPVQCVRWSCAEAFLSSTQWRGIMDRGLEEDWMWSNQQQCSDHQSGVYDDKDEGCDTGLFLDKGAHRVIDKLQVGNSWQFEPWSIGRIPGLEMYWTNTRLGGLEAQKCEKWLTGGLKSNHLVGCHSRNNVIIMTTAHYSFTDGGEVMYQSQDNLKCTEAKEVKPKVEKWSMEAVTVIELLDK